MKLIKFPIGLKKHVYVNPESVSLITNVRYPYDETMIHFVGLGRDEMLVVLQDIETVARRLEE